jgi:hypothetical protein
MLRANEQFFTSYYTFIIPLAPQNGRAPSQGALTAKTRDERASNPYG